MKRPRRFCPTRSVFRFCCMGAVGMAQEWELDDNNTSAETVIRMMFAAVLENLQRILF